MGEGVLYLTASKWEECWACHCKKAWDGHRRGSFIFNSLQMGRSAGIVIERRLELVMGEEVLCLTACIWGGVLDLQLK